MIAKEKTQVTESGIVISTDPSIGRTVFSPFSGLIAAVHGDYAEALDAWLHLGDANAIDPRIRAAVGASWDVDDCDAVYPVPALLPTADTWEHLPSPTRPMLINWFLTGRCPLDCLYCYAEDLMRNDEAEPNRQDIKAIGENILSFAPLVVVLTGGDPLFSPRLGQAMDLLHNRAGIIVDTSGHTLTSDHIQLFKQYRCSVRLSIDATRPKIHDHQRPLHKKYPGLSKHGTSAETAFRALEQCIASGIAVTVQTVATKKNANDLISLGDVLFRMGVRSWRIFKVAPSEKKFDGYKKLVGSHKDDGTAFKGKRAIGPYAHAFKQVMRARRLRWLSRMAVQVIAKQSPNSVVLVSPSGQFLTESNTGRGKVPIDATKLSRPRISQLRKSVDMHGHAERYLNLTSETSD